MPIASLSEITAVGATRVTHGKRASIGGGSAKGRPRTLRQSTFIATSIEPAMWKRTHGMIAAARRLKKMARPMLAERNKGRMVA